MAQYIASQKKYLDIKLIKNIVLLFLLSALILSSCKKETTTTLSIPNEIVIDGVRYALESTYLEGDYKLLLTSNEMVLDSLNRLVEIGCFDVVSFYSWNKLVSGTYDWNNDGEGEAALNFCFPDYTNDYWVSFENSQGSFNVDIRNDSINVSGSGTLSNGKALSFYFNGPLLKVN